MNRTDLFLNTRCAARDAAFPENLIDIVSPASSGRAAAEIMSWPGYARTPVHDLCLASELGVGSITYKDEGGRFGLGSFKVLGGAYAVARLAGEDREPTSLTFVAATDGNHGRAVAWGARNVGSAARIYVHAAVSGPRVRAIETLGATVITVAGTYDDAVRQARDDAAVHGWTVVSDTSYPGNTQVPAWVTQGYTLICHELAQQLGPTPPTHLFIQAGVGGLASSMCAAMWQHYGANRPRVIIVEPSQAACLLATARLGRPARVAGRLNTIMAGLACGEVSELAWRILDPGADAFISIDDEWARIAMRRLARLQGGGSAIVAGESGAAGLAGLIAVLTTGTGMPEALGINRHSRVLLIGTENDTDPANYRSIVGQSAREIGRATVGVTA